jgi:hypothetical protein
MRLQRAAGTGPARPGGELGNNRVQFVKLMVSSIPPGQPLSTFGPRILRASSIRSLTRARRTLLRGSRGRAREPPTPGMVLTTTILASSLGFVDGSVVNVGLPAIGRELARRRGRSAMGDKRLSPALERPVTFRRRLGDPFGRGPPHHLGPRCPPGAHRGVPCARGKVAVGLRSTARRSTS